MEWDLIESMFKSTAVPVVLVGMDNLHCLLRDNVRCVWLRIQLEFIPILFRQYHYQHAYRFRPGVYHKLEKEAQHVGPKPQNEAVGITILPKVSYSFPPLYRYGENETSDGTEGTYVPKVSSKRGVKITKDSHGHRSYEGASNLPQPESAPHSHTALGLERQRVWFS